MNRLISLTALVLSFLLVSNNLFAQNANDQLLTDQLAKKGEVYFQFTIEHPSDIQALTQVISIDKLEGNTVFAYASAKELERFKPFGYEIVVLPHPGDLLNPSELRPPGSGEGARTTWDFYPTYEEYLAFMDEFVTNYPNICDSVFAGFSIQNRELRGVKISDNVGEEEAEPQFLYTATIHGDETTGYPLTLHLIDYLLTNYGTDPRITDMIDHTEIFIFPLTNPDGTYWGGNSSVFGARRYNANNVDLNRNFPDPEDGPHPDGNPWQVETEAMMDLAEDYHFAIGSNYHGGEEVINYPWDTWPTLAADDDWWQFVSHEYADTAHVYSPPGYLTGFNNGITNGYQWYTISGGRQDYMNYFHNCRESTMEISYTKLLPASQLLNHWEYNYRSMLNYIEQVNYGVQGIVTDSVTGEPLQARVSIPLYDIDNSYVNTKLPSGFYSRYLYEGTYTMRFTAIGYFAKTIENVAVENYEQTLLNVKLVPLNIGMPDDRESTRNSFIFPNPASEKIQLSLPIVSGTKLQVTISDIRGKIMHQEVLHYHNDAMLGGATIPVNQLSPGLYVVVVTTPDGSIYNDRFIKK
jgi:hypothetical protein